VLGWYASQRMSCSKHRCTNFCGMGPVWPFGLGSWAQTIENAQLLC